MVDNAPICTKNDTFNSLDDTNILTDAPLIKLVREYRYVSADATNEEERVVSGLNVIQNYVVSRGKEAEAH